MQSAVQPTTAPADDRAVSWDRGSILEVIEWRQGKMDATKLGSGQRGPFAEMRCVTPGINHNLKTQDADAKVEVRDLVVMNSEHQAI